MQGAGMAPPTAAQEAAMLEVAAAEGQPPQQQHAAGSSICVCPGGPLDAHARPPSAQPHTAPTAPIRQVRFPEPPPPPPDASAELGERLRIARKGAKEVKVREVLKPGQLVYLNRQA